MTSIENLIEANPSGLLEMKPALSIAEYRENFGFKLKNIFTIYESERLHWKRENWFAFLGKSLETLFSVQKRSDGDLLVVYILETMKDNKIHCHLVLSDKAYKEILNDKRQHVLAVHQMYTKFLSSDHIALNMAN